MTRDRRLLFAGVTIALALLIGGAALIVAQRDRDSFAGCRKGVVAGGAAALGGPFTLTDETGARVTDKQVFDQPALLYFGYTFCPDVCPLDSARNAEAADLLEEQGKQVRPVFITVDPKRDTPEALRQFTDALHPRMLGLTGTPDEISAVNKLWRNYYKINDAEDPDYYLVDHMTNTFLVLPGHGTVEFFGRDVTPEDMAARTACFMDAAN